MGAAFGGSSQTVFGSRGPGTFLSKVTIAAAVIFMVTSLGLAILSKERTFSSTVIDLNKRETTTPPTASPSTPAPDASKPSPTGEGTSTPAPAAP